MGGETASDRGGGGGAAMAGAVVVEEWEGGEGDGPEIRVEMDEDAARGENDRVGGEVARWAGAEPAAIGDVCVCVDEGEGEAAPSVALLEVSAAAIFAQCGGAAETAAFVVKAASEGEAEADRRDSRMRAIAGGGGEDASREAPIL